MKAEKTRELRESYRGKPVLSVRNRRRRTQRPRVGDWAEEHPSREHLPIAERMCRSLELSSQLSKLPIIGREEPEDVVRMGPEDIVPILDAAGIEFVLVGAHGIGGWLVQTRATQDVDVLIRVKDGKKAAEAILKKLPLTLEKNPDVWRFKRNEQYVVDLLLTRAPLYKRVFKEFHEIGLQGRKVRVPKLEAALATKFAAMVGHYRPPLKRMLDGADFFSMVEANKKINLELLAEISELIYPGAGVDAVKYVNDARAGRDLEI